MNEYCDEFLDDVFDWFPTKLGEPVLQAKRRAYLSQLEVITSMDLTRRLGMLSSVGELITAMMKEYGTSVDGYVPSGLRMHYDVVGKPTPQGPAFVFERRAEEAFSGNIYFTSAPLRFADHWRVLTELEKVFS